MQQLRIWVQNIELNYLKVAKMRNVHMVSTNEDPQIFFSTNSQRQSQQNKFNNNQKNRQRFQSQQYRTSQQNVSTDKTYQPLQQKSTTMKSFEEILKDNVIRFGKLVKLWFQFRDEKLKLFCDKQCGYCLRKSHSAEHCLRNPKAIHFVRDSASPEAKKITGVSKNFAPQVYLLDFENEDDTNYDDFYTQIDLLIKKNPSLLKAMDYNIDDKLSDNKQSSDEYGDPKEPYTMFNICYPSFEDLIQDEYSVQSMEYYIEFLEHKHGVTFDLETGKFRMKKHTIIHALVHNVEGATLIDTGSETNLIRKNFAQ